MHQFYILMYYTRILSYCSNGNRARNTVKDVADEISIHEGTILLTQNEI